MKSNHVFVRQVTVMYSRATLVALTLEDSVQSIISKTNFDSGAFIVWTGTLANSADQDQTPRSFRRRRTQRLIRISTVFLNYRKLRIKWNSLNLIPVRDHSPSLHSRDNRPTHYGNTPIQIYWKLYNQKRENFSIKKSDIVSFFCSKYRLWVLVRTASARRF